MLTKQHKKLKLISNRIKRSVSDLEKALGELLSQEGKDLFVEIDGESYHFGPVFDEKDKVDKLNRQHYVTKVLVSDALEQLLKGNSAWLKTIMAFTYGEDPKDHQLKKEFKEGIIVDLEARGEKNSDGELGTFSLPIDKEAYQHIQETQKDTPVLSVYKLRKKYDYEMSREWDFDMFNLKDDPVSFREQGPTRDCQQCMTSCKYKDLGFDELFPTSEGVNNTFFKICKKCLVKAKKKDSRLRSIVWIINKDN